MKIKHFKDVIPQNEFNAVENILKDRNWTIQSSNEHKRTSFFYSEMNQNEVNFFVTYIESLLNEYIKENNITNQIFLERAYINCHPCFHPGDWHTDNNSGFTVLYYPNSKVDFKEEGSTAFKDFIQPYIKNSVLIFPANILHMATEHSQKGTFRYTIAFKFQIV